jgi:hypothetical protein
MRAQTSVEWAAILGIVLVVSLLLAIAINFLPSFYSPQNLEQSSRAYWGARAYPLQIIDWNAKASGNFTLNLSFVLKNAGGTSLHIRKIILSPGNFSLIYYANGTFIGEANSLDLQLLPRDSVSLIAQGTSENEFPKAYSLNISIIYDGELPSMSQKGILPIVGRVQE